MSSATADCDGARASEFDPFLQLAFRQPRENQRISRGTSPHPASGGVGAFYNLTTLRLEGVNNATVA